MKLNVKIRRSAIVMFVITASVFVLVQCVNKAGKNQTEEKISFESFAGSEKCAGCHKEIFESHLLTAHNLSGQPALEKYIKGSFQDGKNTYSYTPSILLSMEKRDSSFYQVAFFKGEEKKAMRFDMVIGSGVMGQSFLTWRNNKLFQLPITYFTAADQWSNSPGFPSDRVLIDRPVTSRCLECHATYAQGIAGTEMEPSEFDHNKIIYGVGCEKCHGPAAKHVEFQTQHPENKTAKFIVNPSSLSRQLQLDICALCHGGNIQKTKPSFQFTAGKRLSDFFVTDTLNENVVNSGNVDVHGNQYGLLRASKCFRMSKTLTCNTCHNTHKNERANLELFSQRCTGCHNPTAAEFKTPVHSQITAIEKNCIDCHMPAQPSRSIAVFLEGKETPKASLLRSHFIGIYPEETNKFNKQNKK